MPDVPEDIEERRAFYAAKAAQHAREFDRNRAWWLGFWAQFGKVMASFVALGPLAFIFGDTTYATFGSAMGGAILWGIGGAITGHDAGDAERRRFDERPV